MSYLDQAQVLLEEWVQSESLRKHCYAVSDSMRHLASQQGADEDLWAAVGLLHDMDYERYPTLGTDEASNHPYVGVAYLREHGWGEEVTRAILSHADYSGVEPISPMEKSLRAVDELSGFVTAVTLVKPSKSIADVDVASVKKKMKDKAFARAVSRDDIRNGAELLGVPLEDLIQSVIEALKADAKRLGLEGVAPA